VGCAGAVYSWWIAPRVFVCGSIRDAIIAASLPPESGQNWGRLRDHIEARLIGGRGYFWAVADVTAQRPVDVSDTDMQ
jgi:hypothetical protein